MIKTKFTVPIYNVDVLIIQVESKEDLEIVKKTIKWINPTEEIINEIADNTKNEDVNGGILVRNDGWKRYLCLFYPFTCADRKIETYDHEKRHLEDRIMNLCEVHDEESAALLAGYLGVKFRNFEKLTENG